MTKDFPFVTYMLRDMNGWPCGPLELTEADGVAKGISALCQHKSNGVIFLALLLYAEQIAEGLAKKLGYSLESIQP